MYKYKFYSSFLIAAFLLTSAYGQDKPGSDQTKTVTGTVIKMDFVGSIISIQTDNQHQLSFFVPSNAVLSRETHDIGLMDIKGGHPVTIQYDVVSPGKYNVLSIIDNKPSADDTIDE